MFFSSFCVHTVILIALVIFINSRLIKVRYILILSSNAIYELYFLITIELASILQKKKKKRESSLVLIIVYEKMTSELPVNCQMK